MAPLSPPSPSLAEPSPARWRLCVLTFVTLSLALALARLLPAEVQAVSWFPSLVPMAGLFGLGLGLLLQERRTLRWLFPGGLALVALFILGTRGLVGPEDSEAARFWLAGEPLPRLAIHVPGFRLRLPAAGLAFILTALPFVALGQALARAMDRHSRLAACAWCIAGGLVATALLVLSSLFGLPPWAWIAAVAGLGAATMVGSRMARVTLVAAGLLFLLPGQFPLQSRWSAYSLVQHHTTPSGLAVFVNARAHQFAFDLTSDDEEDRRIQAEVLARWRRPYELFRAAHGHRPETVLVLGAGIGNDVAVALGEGVLRVVAVEIDPVILELGRTLNLSDPYSDPRVEAVVDDPRQYLRSSGESFDLVVFGTLDAQDPPNDPGGLPFASRAWTREVLEEAKGRLAEGGLLVAYSSVHDDRLLPGLDATIRSVFGHRTRLTVHGPRLLNATLLASRDLDSIHDGNGETRGLPDGLPATDDWPYLSGKRLAVPPLYLRILGVAAALVIGAVALAWRLQPVRGLHAGYLLLGVGFGLTGAAAVSRLALLFGGAWLVDAATITGTLVAVIVAGAVVLRGKPPPTTAAWAGLLASVLLNFAVPVSALLTLGAGGRTAAAALLIGGPVFGGALCFSQLFRDEPVAGYPLGVCLVGAMAGTLLGRLSMATGMQALWLLALGAFALAWLITATLRRERSAKDAAR